MSSQEVPISVKAAGKGNRDRGTLRGGQLLPETQEKLATNAPQEVAEMASQTPKLSTTQLTREKAPAFRNTDLLTEVEEAEDSGAYSTVPGAAAAEPVEPPTEGTDAPTRSGKPDESWTVAQLQEEASKKGLPTSGTKAELIERLTA